MIDNNCKVFQAVRYGTPPHVAMKRVSTLIEKGVDVDLVLFKDYNDVSDYNAMGMPLQSRAMHYINYSLLAVAIVEGHYHIVKTLIEKGANCANIANTEHQNPIDVAIMSWFKAYSCKQSRKSIVVPTAYNTFKYQGFWPWDEELKTYRILKYLLHFRPNITVSTDLLRGINRHYCEREVRQAKVNHLFETILNQHTNTSIGTEIVRYQTFMFENYLLYNDILFD